MYKLVIRPILFLLQPEKVHHLVVALLRIAIFIPGVKFIKQSCNYKNPSLERQFLGLKFKNPIGLAAGFDKDAHIIKEMEMLGFGFVEIGTLTPLAQYGNTKPRLFRLKQDNALINRMGFNNNGVEEAVLRLKKQHHNIRIGGNIGKNKTTSNEFAADDYTICFKALFDYVDYFVVNVSSPNTPNLRELQDKEPLTKLLKSLVLLNSTYPKSKPILLKIAPDLTDAQLDDIIEIVQTVGIDGIVATNTTILRNGLKTPESIVQSFANGGLSGVPLKTRSTEVIAYIHRKSEGKIPIIGVGGIHSPKDAIEKLKAGASLIQLYTGFIYEGPNLINKINREIVKQDL